MQTNQLKYWVGLSCLALSLVPGAISAQMQAIPGRPFGIGSVSIRVPQADADGWKQARIEEAAGRIFYPAKRSGVLPGVPGNRPAPNSLTISFLFTGDAPLDITVRTPDRQQFRVVPQRQPPRFYRRHLNRWWRDYNASVRQEAQRDDYPQLVHVYLSSMLGNRLGLQPPLLSRRAASDGSELQKTVELLAGAETLRNKLVQEMMQPSEAPGSADQMVPEGVRWSAIPTSEILDVEIEPLANRVPAECFYIRFGTFRNYLWLSGLLKEYGGDIGRMVSLRGQDSPLHSRLQRQLALRESTLAEILGPSVIADVAFIGRDMYMSEGAAMGILFQAHNNFALSTDLKQQRATALQANQEKGATLETIEIAGREVSYLSTPDNRLRSYYAVDDRFHLVTTSRAIVERFFEAGEGEGSLGGTFEFQNARQVMPIDRNDTIFAYFSAAFFQSLVAPQYQIELRRRLQADAAISLVQLARLAARAEGLADPTLDDLTGAGFLPAGFGRLADGSGPIVAADRTIDSLRGSRGAFLPIPDVDLQRVSADEASWYTRAASYFQENWQQMDPLIVGIQRVEGEQAGVERLVIDANVSPLAEEKYGWILSLLGPASTHEVVPTDGDIITMQATVKGGMLSPNIGTHQLFLGLKDSPMPVDPSPVGAFQVFKMLREAPGYLGAWPNLGFLDWLPLGPAGQPDPAGFSRLPLGAWRWQGDGFSVTSFRREVLDATVPQLRTVPTDNPAQIRLRVGDLSQSALTGWINSQNYDRARQASVGNVQLMHVLTQQLGVASRDAKQEAEVLVDGRLVCALGGEYRPVEREDAVYWLSTAWPEMQESPDSDYRAPVLQWFRGLRLDLTKSGELLVMHAEVDMHRAAANKKSSLPFLDLFGSGER